MKQLKKLKSFIDNTFSTSVKFVLIGVLLIGVVMLIGYGIEEYQTNQKEKQIEDIQEGFYEKVANGEISSSKSGLGSFFQLTKEELDEMTIDERAQLAKKEVDHFGVYDLKLNIKTNEKGKFVCAEKVNFEFNDFYSAFVMNEKWSNYFKGLSLLTTDYKIQYFSNVYVDGHTDFPLQYKEDYIVTKEWTTLRSNYQEFVLNDEVQIVLPGKVNQKIPDDINLDYLITIEYFEDGEKITNEIKTIPLSINNGNLELLKYQCGD